MARTVKRHGITPAAVFATMNAHESDIYVEDEENARKNTVVRE